MLFFKWSHFISLNWCSKPRACWESCWHMHIFFVKKSTVINLFCWGLHTESIWDHPGIITPSNTPVGRRVNTFKPMGCIRQNLMRNACPGIVNHVTDRPSGCHGDLIHLACLDKAMLNKTHPLARFQNQAKLKGPTEVWRTRVEAMISQLPLKTGHPVKHRLLTPS